ncbi:SDR family NAD(P)-dependent oxidoreductase [Neorhizobium alkalisoli]|uniref:dTDP-L-rhamnose 4-epimerase n=1 Tax=Neorhizobium alkalisoli TaxID=528178 RepID=A0A561R3J9_9HYPH|nr:SDR family NAD(P)-dependent oxidoreductase [Neorhizobium alkalisoli]TWF57153.1 dTDP-L-rhamnose 4-epimerase [Neorhizobium alkalisoli]
MRVLVTGGAGFIGSRFVRQLEARGADKILIYDNLHPQVHGKDAIPPTFGPKVEFVNADIRDATQLKAIVANFAPTAVAHLVSETGTGQSYDEISRYVEVNVSGTAYLLEAIRALPRQLDWFLLTSSRAVYGEGAYVDSTGQHVSQARRFGTDMSAGRFQVYGRDGSALTEVPSASVTTQPDPLSIYASTKLMQENLVDNALSLTSTRLLVYRFQNVYGAGQSLINPYTGVLSIFIARLLNGLPIAIFEDGEISRDFVYVDDVVEAMMLGAMSAVVPRRPMDVGAAVSTRIYDAAVTLAKLAGKHDFAPSISGEFRPGDIRHAMADISYTHSLLDWSPKISFEEGARRLFTWAAESIKK